MVAVAVFAVAVCACGGNRKKGGGGEAVTGQVTSKTSGVAENIITPPVSGIVKLAFTDGRAEAIIRKAEGKTVYLEFESEGYKKLTGSLSSDDAAANVRFAQIFMPDGTADGPFGPGISYDLPSDGAYKLSVNENIMAGDPWSGVFKVEITLGN